MRGVKPIFTHQKIFGLVYVDIKEGFFAANELRKNQNRKHSCGIRPGGTWGICPNQDFGRQVDPIPIGDNGGRGAGGRLRPQHRLIPAKLFLIILSKFQEFCLDLYQPSGMGRRRKRTRKSRNADDEGHLGYFYPVTPSTKQRRNNSRVLNDPKENFGTATNINDNVGVTVIMPPGK